MVSAVQAADDSLAKRRRQNSAQNAQKSVPRTCHIHRRRILFPNNMRYTLADILRIHAVLLVLFHSADTPGYPSAIFLIAKNTLLSRVCKSGMDVPQLHYRYPDTIWLHLVVQGTGIG